MSCRGRVAVVTGANKGIGLAVVRVLCAQFQGDVFLTARNEAYGTAAVKELQKDGLHPRFHQLDVTDRSSIARLKSCLEADYGGLDVLVNNAGIGYTGNPATESTPEQAEMTMRCNFWGTLDVCNALFPLLRPHARVVNVSSRTTTWQVETCSEALRARFLSPTLTMTDVGELMTDFVQTAKEGRFKEKGWNDSAYSMSKVGVYLMSVCQQAQFNDDLREDIIVNACCPGYTATDMTGNQGDKTAEEAADTPVYLALLPPHTVSPRGEFVMERKFKPWPQYVNADLPSILQKKETCE